MQVSHQQALQKDTTAVIFNLLDLQTQYKNDDFLADLQNYDGKGYKFFTDWTMLITIIAHLSQHPELLLARAKTEGIVYKLTEDINQLSIWKSVKKRLCHVFSSVSTKMHAATQIHSRPQTENKSLQDYIQRPTDLVMQVTGDHCLVH